MAVPAVLAHHVSSALPHWVRGWAWRRTAGSQPRYRRGLRWAAPAPAPAGVIACAICYAHGVYGLGNAVIAQHGHFRR